MQHDQIRHQEAQQVSSISAPALKVLRNTYMLLGMTLIFSAVMALISMAINPPSFTGIVTTLSAMVLFMFVLPRFANSGAGIGLVFLGTGLLGFGLGPILNAYLAFLSNGSEIIFMSMASTAVIFLGLSATALITKKDFGFMGKFLFVGILIAFVAGIANLFFGIPALSLAISSAFIALMSGLILYETSEIVHGRETNYVMATVSLYITIFNLFVSLLQILGIMGGED